MTIVSKAAGPLLLVEDTLTLAHVYQSALEAAGYQVECVHLAKEARRAHRGAQGRIVLLDLLLPDGDGLDLLKEMRAADPDGKVIVVTSHASVNSAVTAMRDGAFDFLMKPFDDQRLVAAVNNAAQSQGRLGENGADNGGAGGHEGFRGFVGASPDMRRIYKLISEIGRSTATVFITGESGTGKEVAAQAIHAESQRANGPFVPLNCGAIPRDLLESEVFGHLKGSFTGAIADNPGAAVSADGGTLFLDEVCEMDLALQTKLLRFLQTSTVTPVGSSAPRKVDARIICATNRDPQEEVRAGRFREDLYYRLHVVPIHLPPLRERAEDVLTIANAFLQRYATEEGKPFTHFDEEVKSAFLGMSWPGNVRQLQNMIWNIVLLNEGPVVTTSMLPVSGLDGGAPGHASPALRAEEADAPLGDAIVGVDGLVGSTMAEIEREFIEATIRSVGGSIPKAAQILDLSPSTIYRKREAWAKTGD
ncbi:MAG: sigma-54 dependent transcriptional regulator [Pseudomonadota bacterium]